MHKHYAYRYDLEAQLIDREVYSNSALVFFFLCYVTILLVLFTGINKKSMHFQLWH